MSKHQKHMVNTDGDRDPENGVKAELDSLGNMRSLASHFFLFRETPKSSLYLFQAVYSWSWNSYGRHSEERVIILKPLHTQIKMETIFRLNIKGQYDSVYLRLELKVKQEAGRGGICSRAEITPCLPM